MGDFCSQEHAAEWLRRPLPKPLAPSPPPGPTSWSHRLAMGGCFAVFLVLVACLAIGGWTVVRFLLDHV
ncbi:hypothetical protein [Blastococcus haudaquaticus]|uniref:Uncharacterized protein n=1 Tax=Blastococcus haudaquaticus TaxID=1938745 RepID=A0A286H520_9ACTN|nr:hypothetical protein [Blastococcus haudaquaticus]SOE02895.1 hypothetical protein SAMN06272739_3855 [Blastococcus haudaquaticus]